MFDPQGELAFIDQCRSVLAERTVILVTHRPASLALADRVVALAKGRVVCDEPATASAGSGPGPESGPPP